MLWQAYAHKRGTLNDGLRMEWLMARLTMLFHNVNVKEQDRKGWDHFHRYAESTETEQKQPATPEEFAALFGAKRKK